MMLPPPRKEIKYLKVSELEVDKYYTCALSKNKVFIKSISNGYANGVFYYKGEYLHEFFTDYMLY